MNALIWLYGAALRLFPKGFRKTFGAEMSEVFARSLEEARREGALAVIGLMLREGLDLPASALGEHVYLLVQGRQPVLEVSGATTSLSGSDQQGSLLDGILAGLPHLLIGLLMAIGPLMQYTLGMENQTEPRSISGILLLSFVAASIIATIVLGWRRWQASWYLYWLILAIAGLQFLSQFFPRFLQANRLASYGNTLVFFVLPLVMAYVLYRVTRANKVSGVLAALPLMLISWAPFMEHSPMDKIDPGGEGLTHLIAWSSGAAAAFAIARGAWVGRAILLAIVVNALAGIPYTIIGIYQGGMLNFSEPGPNPGAVMRLYLPHLVGISTLVLGPQLASLIRELGLKAGRYGRWLYRATLFGLLMSFAGVLLSAQGTFGDGYSPEFLGQLAKPLLTLGTPVFVVTFCLTVYGAWKAEPMTGQWELVLLMLAAGMTPFALMQGMPPQNLRYVVTTAGALAAAVGWMGLATFVVVRADQRVE